MNLVVNINATDVVFPEPLLLVERLKTNEQCPMCDNSDFYVKVMLGGAIRVECEHCGERWPIQSTSKPVSAFRGGITKEDIMSKASKARKGNIKKSTAVDALIANKKTDAGVKSKTGKAELKVKTSVIKKPSKADELKGKKFVFVEGKARPTSGTGKIAAAFGKGKRVSDVVADQVLTFERKSKGSNGVDESMILYFIKEAIKVGAIVEA